MSFDMYGQILSIAQVCLFSNLSHSILSLTFSLLLSVSFVVCVFLLCHFLSTFVNTFGAIEMVQFESG